MKTPPYPHPADMCDEPCSTTPRGFSAEADYTIGSLGNPPRFTGHGYAVSHVSQEDAKNAAMVKAQEEASKRMELYLTTTPIPVTWKP